MNHVQIKNADCLIEMKNISDKSIDMILCDLPYGTTACKWDVIIPFEPLWKEYKRIIKDRGCIALFGSEPFSSYLILSNIINFKYRINWDKLQGSGFLNSKKRPLTRVEDICIFSKLPLGRMVYYPQIKEKEKSKIRPVGKRKPCDVTTYGKHSSRLSDNYDNSKSHPSDIIQISSKIAECNSLNRVHPTQKPVALLEYLIKTYTLENETVLDNTMGSGSTGVACVNTNRNFIGIEKDPEYFKIAEKRIREAQENYQPELFSNVNYENMR